MDAVSWFILCFFVYVLVALVVLATSLFLKGLDDEPLSPANADIVAVCWPGIVVALIAYAVLYPLDRAGEWWRRSRR